MKSEKGITLISLTVYVIVLSIVVGIIAIITTFFYKNINSNKFDVEPMAQYVKFNSYFSEEMNKENIKIAECDANYIVFNNGVQYSYIAENKGVYRNKVKICSGITDCTFTVTTQNEKNVVIVVLTIGNETKTTTYTLK